MIKQRYKTDVIIMYKEILSGTRRRFPNNTWDDVANIKIVVKYLIEEELRWSKEDIKQKLSWDILRKYKLSGLLSDDKIKGSPYKIINIVYPNEFLPWELCRSPINTWNKDNSIKAIQWLSDKLKCNVDEMPLTADLLRKHNLSGLLSFYEGSTVAILKDLQTTY